MNTMITAMNAVPCGVVARPRPVGQILLATTAVTLQGTVVPFAALGTPIVVVDARAFEGSSVDAPTYKTTDVVRSHLGRPPV
ncbi:MAG: hypothetical protein L0H79_15995 [Intrasporangium sp.]|uniref:hypothetical protein n=1 Tax=Intrasporangium sp. TaxID=1925024 RepID=UPI002649D8D9|nr:hypothetical protein [Intrasporangium sp.]MDN5797239.1 hypothetical protein [Intrasporangium sp.]